MPLDPEIAAIVQRVNEAPPLSAGTPREGRDAIRALNRLADRAAPPPEVAAVEDVEIDGGDGPIRARVYRPGIEAPHPTLVFLHGGGFVIGDLETYDGQCRLLCRRVEATVLSVGYRLAPEAPFPAAVEDAIAATAWAAQHVGELGGRADRLAVGGDSAGGNLAAVVAQARRDDEPPLAAQLLIYPRTDFVAEHPSFEENGRGYMLTIDDMEWFHGHYLPNGADPADPRLSPARGRLEGLPPAVVATAEFDPLRDDGDAYAAALAQAGVRVIHRRFDGLVHGFFALGGFSRAAAAAAEQICADLRELLA